VAQSFASERLHGIATRLRAEGERGVARRMGRRIRVAAQPLARSADEAARQRLPHSGGLNELVADRQTRISVLTGARSAGVRLRRLRSDSAAYQTDHGYVHHRTFGRDPWERQELPGAAGWFTDTMRDGSPAITPVLAEMNAIGREIQGGY
jgi:hypothetical protein